MATHNLPALVIFALASIARPALGDGNLLTLGRISDSFGVLREQRLVDGRLPAATSPIDDFSASLFLEGAAFVEFDLGETVPLAAVQLVAIDDGVVVTAGSAELEYRDVTLEPAGEAGKMQIYVARSPDLQARFLRLELRGEREKGAVGEVLAFRELPAGLPVAVEALEPPDYDAAVARILATERWVSRAMLALAAGSIPLLLLAARWRGRRRWILCSTLIAMGIGGWIRLGTFHGDGRVLHAWDLTHYYLNAKYFDELRYTELYRCLAAHEREKGRGFMIDRSRVRNLDDNQVLQGSWTQTDAGACRAEISPERWRAFGADADGVRRLFVYRHFHQALRDHGYNATPLQTAVLGALVKSTEARPGTFWLFFLLDVLAISVAVWALWWAFGPLTAAAAALLIGYGDPWGFNWTGGSLGRYFWLAALCGGLALLHRRRHLSGAFLVTASAMMRLFPGVLLAGPAIWALRSFVDRRHAPAAARLALGAAAAILAGAAIPAMIYGADVYAQFFANTRIHAGVPPSNHLGLGALVSAGLDESVLGLPSAAPAEGTPGTSFIVRRFAWLAGVLAALAFLIWAQRREREPWEGLVLAAPLLFCTLPLSSYDYVWLVVLVPVAVTSRLRLATLLGFVALTNLFPEFVAESKAQYLAVSAALLVVLVIFFLDLSRDDEKAAARRIDDTPRRA